MSHLLNLINRSLLALVLILLCPALCFAQGWGGVTSYSTTEPLVLSVSKGPAPLTVRIVGPKRLVDKVNSWDGRFVFGSSGFSISWGDGVHEPQRKGDTFYAEKKDYLQHTYTVPGGYNVNTSIYHLGPNDGAVTDWKSMTGVQVTGAPRASAVNVEFISPKGGENCKYQNFPDVEWRLNTDRKVDVHIELISGDKVLVHQVVKGVSTTGFHHRDVLGFQTWDDLDAILRKGTGRFKVRIILVDQQGKSIYFRDSREFFMTAQSGLGGLRLISRDVDNRLRVTLGYEIWHPQCFSYRIDWGDGNFDEKIAPPGGVALNDKQEKTFVHTYQSAKRYTVKLHSNNFDTFKKLSEIVSYESIDLDLTK